MTNEEYKKIVKKYTKNEDKLKELYFDTLGYIGDPVDISYYHSLYYDTDGDLIWSRMHEGDDKINIIYF